MTKSKTQEHIKLDAKHIVIVMAKFASNAMQIGTQTQEKRNIMSKMKKA